MMVDKKYGNHNIILDCELGIKSDYAVNAKDLKSILTKYARQGRMNSTSKQIAKLIKDMEITATEEFVSVCYIRPNMFALVFRLPRDRIEKSIKIAREMSTED